MLLIEHIRHKLISVRLVFSLKLDMRFVLGFLFLFLTTTLVVAQERNCGTEELLKLKMSELEIQLERDRFEEWLSNQSIDQVRTRATESLDEDIVYQIPVVVHIIHKGEPEGAGTNIPDEQIFAQIESLNLDFRHLNADSVNTPPQFRALMADSQMEFVLAKRNPDGFATNGITRTNGGTIEWSIRTNTALKSLSYWPSEDYLNIWVAPLAGTLLGWAEFPTSTILAGINEFANDNPLTDGVVVTTTSFGSKTLYPQGIYNNNFNEGRTLTHEIGHFFGLRHIWGDGDCSKDDFVADTPRTSDNYSGCPNIGQGILNSCENGELSMYMNYMDYTYDACMNLFSLGQKDRMHTVLNNSPRRLSLLSSEALVPPPPLEVVAADIINPGSGVCRDVFTPELRVANIAITPINNLEVEMSLNRAVIQSKSFDVSLADGESAILSFDEVLLPDNGLYQLDFTIVGVNGGIDEDQTNNTLGQQVNYSQVFTSLDESLTSWIPESWATRSEAPLTQWKLSNAPNLMVNNTSAILSYYENSASDPDFLITPTLDLNDKNSAYLLFDYSYVGSEAISDEFYVLVSNDCGNNFTDTLSNLTGISSRETGFPKSYSPSGPSDWQTIVLNLSDYIGDAIQIAFVGKSNSGNNIYLDNVKLKEAGYQDIAIKGLINETGVFKDATGKIKLWIENSGSTTITAVTIKVNSNGNAIHTITANNLNLLPGDRQVIETGLDLSQGSYDLEFELDQADDNSNNDSYQAKVNIYDSNQTIPFREFFNDDSWILDGSWSVSSPGDDVTWQAYADFIGTKSFTFGNKGLRDWLVLPPFDFSETLEAGLRFKYSYAENNYNLEVLRIWASTNDGESFDHLIQTLAGDDIITMGLAFDFIPDSEEDWRDIFVDLSSLAGEESVLLAFELTDGDGNNFYIDELDLFTSADSEAISLELGEMAVYPNPVNGLYTMLTFSLNEKQDIRVRVIDMKGQTISDQILTDVINQTYPLELSSELDGIYVVKATGVNFDSATRIMLNR